MKQSVLASFAYNFHISVKFIAEYVGVSGPSVYRRSNKFIQFKIHLVHGNYDSGKINWHNFDAQKFPVFTNCKFSSPYSVVGWEQIFK